MSHNNVQSVIFDKSRWTEKKAKKWLKLHGFKSNYKEPDITKNFIRFRQREPTFLRYSTKKTDDGIEFIIGYYV